MADRERILSRPALTAVEVAQVERLVAAATAADGAPALNEAAHLHLRHPRPGVRHLLALADGDAGAGLSGAELVGYAEVEAGEGAATGQVVVAPDHRRRGLGTALVERLRAESAQPVQFWAVGDSPAAQSLARRSGLVPRRTLLVMRRPSSEPLPVATLPEDVRLRAFVPGTDDQAWLAVNARAFAHHPEQGALTAADLAERTAEAWFDPAGFLLAVRGTRVLGFHWTKQHPDHLGEVYVIGVDPDAGGQGLGKALLGAGLEHLARSGSTVVQLYVEADHDRAVGLYRSYGFVPAARDVMYAQP
ncbi:MAG: mshD [Friedmanniella sp.]|nr:mshD [Friedmanniella sp.]